MPENPRELEIGEILSHTWQGITIRTTYLGEGRNRLENGQEFETLTASAAATAKILGQDPARDVIGEEYWCDENGLPLKQREASYLTLISRSLGDMKAKKTKIKFEAFREPQSGEILTHSWKGKTVKATYLGGGRVRLENGEEFGTLSGGAKAAAEILGQNPAGVNGKVFWQDADGISLKRREAKGSRQRSESFKPPTPPLRVVGERRERASDAFLIFSGRREADRIVQKLLNTEISELKLELAMPGMTLLSLYNAWASRKIAIG